jgi:hypothetical protein
LILLALCLAATLLHPAAVLLAGPLLLGVPHVLADLRLLPLSKSVLIWTAILTTAAFWLPRTAVLGFAYLHNFIAVAVLLYYSRNWPLALVHLLISSAILLGFLPFNDSAFGGFSLTSFAETMSPGLSADFGMRLVLLFAFTQAFHYAVWLVLLPRERKIAVWGGDRRLLAGVAAAAVVVAVCGAWRPVETRDAYLYAAGFHAWLELAAMAHVRLA